MLSRFSRRCVAAELCFFSFVCFLFALPVNSAPIRVAGTWVDEATPVSDLTAVQVKAVIQNTVHEVGQTAPGRGGPRAVFPPPPASRATPCEWPTSPAPLATVGLRRPGRRTYTAHGRQ